MEESEVAWEEAIKEVPRREEERRGGQKEQRLDFAGVGAFGGQVEQALLESIVRVSFAAKVGADQARLAAEVKLAELAKVAGEFQKESCHSEDLPFAASLD